MLWELSLGIAIFTYLIGTVENKKRRPSFCGSSFCRTRSPIFGGY
jgi:hypothetical protein